jgi:hypothetical protein
LAVVAAGCGGTPPTDRYVPPPDAARSALELALRSWQKGRPPGEVEGAVSPRVILVDNGRRPGQTLSRFTILGETAGEGPRCFAVRLRLEEPEEEQRLRFVVFGVDPLWVYRYEDYEMMIHWQCGPEERDDRSTSSTKKSRGGPDAAR